jgi:hypothetical protein
VSGGELGGRSYVQHDDVSGAQAGGQLVASDGGQLRSVAEVGAGELVEPRDVLGRDVAHRRHSAPTCSLASE